MKKIVICTAALFCSVTFGGEFDKVKITPDMSYLYVYHKGKAVKIHRIQDTKHKLTGEYAKTYRPGTHIQPIKIAPGVKTIAEVELLRFLKKKGNRKMGLLIDVRERHKYIKETIPSAVNIPLETLHSPKATQKLLKVFAGKKQEARKVLDLVVFCDGLWCNKSTQFIKKLLEHGYPEDKIAYYRGGIQMWKILGFTTVKDKR